MIIELILTAIYNILDVLMVLEIPSLPDSIYRYFGDFIYYLTQGGGIIATYTHFSYITTLFFTMISIEVGIMLYKFIMWILRKIPMLNIS